MKHQGTLSRRSIAKGAALLLGTAGTQVFSWSDPAPAASEPIRRTIKFTPASSNAFAALADEHFPGYLSNPMFQTIKPYTFIIENASSVGVKAHSVTWIIKTRTGTTQTTLSQFFSPQWGTSGSPDFGTLGNRTRMTGQVSLMGKKGLRLVSPFFSWSPKYYAQHPNIDVNALLQRTTQAQFLAAQLPLMTGVTVQLESVVFSDNVLVGEDRALLGKQYSIRRNAEHDEASSVHKLVLAKAAKQQVETRLVKHASGFKDKQGRPIGRTNPSAFLYYSVRQKQAKILLARFLSVDYNRFLRTVKYLTKQPKTVVRTLAV